MELLFLLFTGFTIGLSGAMLPGPLTLYTISGTLRTNKYAGFKTIAGHIIIELAVISVILLGFRNFLFYDTVLDLIAVLGGIALVSMGIKLLLNAGKMKLAGKTSISGYNKSLVLGGIVFSIASPGFLVWWTTIGLSTIIKAYLSGIIGVLFLLIGHWTADILWYGALSFTVDKGKRYLGRGGYQNLIRVLSFFLILIGLQFIFNKL